MKQPDPRRVRTIDDKLRHTPVHVIWEITLACNLKCMHCGSRAGPPRSDELNTTEALDIVDQLAQLGTREITLIGGEAYLRRDWLTLVQAIHDKGMHCGLQTGARALTKDKIAKGVEAGLRSIGVSIDGPPKLHDHLRGVPGSYDQAMQALRTVASLGISPGVNTQINSLSLPHLEGIFEAIIDAGAKFWQVQITVAMGQAVDNDHILLQPYQMVEMMDRLAVLFHEGRRRGLRLLPGNSIGYYGPHERHWRTLTHEPTPWSGCTAGETALGLEADGKIKGCPSLPADAYLGGMSREVTVAKAIDNLRGRVARLSSSSGGFCGSCYYWNVCRAGCTWVGHMLAGQRGDNPFCYYRVRELAKRGIVETIVKSAEAPGLPFDGGRFDVVATRRDGSVVPRSEVVDNKRQGGGERLGLCISCDEYVFTEDEVCPHCGHSTGRDLPPAAEIGAHVSRLIGTMASDEAALQGVLDRIERRRTEHRT